MSQAREKLEGIQFDGKSFKGLVELVNTFIRMIKAYLQGTYREIPWKTLVLLSTGLIYFIMPLDLIPDFIPVVGYLDELILIPAGLWVLLRLIPEQILSECRCKAGEWLASGSARPRSSLGAAMVIVIWIMIAWWLVSFFATPLGE